MERKVRLVVQVRDRWGERELTLDYDDRTQLDAQLEAFERLRSRTHDRYHLHEFRNTRGETIAFIDQVYARHRVDGESA